MAGVSQPTVSRALRNDPRVAPATADLIKAAARRMGYVPDAAGRWLSTRRSGIAAVVVADITNPFYPELVEAVHHELARFGYRSILVNERTDAPAASLGALLGERVVDGAIVATATLDERTRRLLREGEGPIVQLVREVDGVSRDAVVSDNRQGGALAAGLLARLGHRHIGVIAGPSDTSTARQRLAGLAAALDQAGVALDASLRRDGDYAHSTGYEACLELLDLRRPPTAIVCGNDVIALGVLDAARALGVGVPGDLSVVGFDDIALASWESFRLTTVRQPLVEMARHAARRLVWRIDQANDELPRRVVFPAELIERATTGPVPGSSASRGRR